MAASNKAHYFLWLFKGVKPATNVAIVPSYLTKYCWEFYQ